MFESSCFCLAELSENDGKWMSEEMYPKTLLLLMQDQWMQNCFMVVHQRVRSQELSNRDFHWFQVDSYFAVSVFYNFCIEGEIRMFHCLIQKECYIYWDRMNVLPLLHSENLQQLQSYDKIASSIFSHSGFWSNTYCCKCRIDSFDI